MGVRNGNQPFQQEVSSDNNNNNYMGDLSNQQIEDQDSKVITILEEVTAENYIDEEDDESLIKLVREGLYR